MLCNTDAVMGDDNWRRRELLKSTGASVLGITGLTSVAAASENEIERVRSKKKSQILLEEVNNPEITSGVKKEFEDFSGVILTTEVGRLIYIESGREEVGVQFQIETKQTEHALPRRYAGVPEGEKGYVFLDRDGSPQFIRGVSTDEEDRVLSNFEADPSRTLIFYNTLVDGYEVQVFDEQVATDPESMSGLSPKQLNARDVYYLRHRGDAAETSRLRESDSFDVEVASTPEIQAASGDCEKWAQRCYNQVMICFACAGVCYSVPVTNLPGVLVCLACVLGCHGTVPVACGKAVQNCDAL